MFSEPPLQQTLSRASSIATTHGITTLARKTPPWIIQQCHNYIPTRGRVDLNGVTSCIPQRLGIEHLPEYLTQYVQTDDADYEAQYIACIREYVQPGDDVVLVGGGNGISTVATARAAAPDGEIVVYEAARESVERTRRTAELNDVDDRVTVEHAVVANDYATRGDSTRARCVSPTDLESCDVLAIDADGAELDILDALAIAPDRVIVEHHAVVDDDELVVEYQPTAVRESLWRAGHRVVEEQSDPTAAYGRYEERVLVAESGGAHE